MYTLQSTQQCCRWSQWRLPCRLVRPVCVCLFWLNNQDVFLVCDNGRGNFLYQIWVNNKDAGFSLSQQGSLPSGVQAISFADVGKSLELFFSNHTLTYCIDRDGTIDMVFPTCSHVSSTGVGSDCYINIAYNQQLNLCSSSTDSGLKKGIRTCRPPGDLCTADANFKFDLTNRPDNDVSTFFLYL